MTDPIADLIIRIKTALSVKRETADIPHSKLKEAVVNVLTAEGYLGKFNIMQRMNKKFIRINLKYRKNKTGVINKIKRVSKPGRRIYSQLGALPRIQSGFGTAIISTSQGLMTDEEARAKKIGGEILCYVW